MNTITSAAHKRAYTTRVLFLWANVFTYSLRGGLPPKKRKVPFSYYQDFLLVTMASPHKCLSVGGLSKSQTSLFKAYSLTSYSSVLERKKITSNCLSYLPIQTCSGVFKRSIAMATHIYPSRPVASGV